VAAIVPGEPESYCGHLYITMGGYNVSTTTERRLTDPNGDLFVVPLDREKLY